MTSGRQAGGIRVSATFMEHRDHWQYHTESRVLPALHGLQTGQGRSNKGYAMTHKRKGEAKDDKRGEEASRIRVSTFM
jgi:hypothetical protein